MVQTKYDVPVRQGIRISLKESYLHGSRRNHICLHRFIYAVNDLWEDAYICPINIMNRTTKSAIYAELTVAGWVPKR